MGNTLVSSKVCSRIGKTTWVWFQQRGRATHDARRALCTWQACRAAPSANVNRTPNDLHLDCTISPPQQQRTQTPTTPQPPPPVAMAGQPTDPYWARPAGRHWLRANRRAQPSNTLRRRPNSGTEQPCPTITPMSALACFHSCLLSRLDSFDPQSTRIASVLVTSRGNI